MEDQTPHVFGDTQIEIEAASWISAVPADVFQQLVDGYAETSDDDPASPLAGFLETWIRIEQGKQSLLELLA